MRMCPATLYPCDCEQKCVLLICQCIKELLEEQLYDILNIFIFKVLLGLFRVYLFLPSIRFSLPVYVFYGHNLFANPDPILI